jgi:hypothetical protein
MIKRVSAIAFFIFISLQVYPSNIVINLNYDKTGNFSVKDIFNFAVINNSSSIVKASLEISVKNLHDPVVLINNPLISLSKGLNNNWNHIFTSSQITYFGNQASSSFKSIGILPAGEYEVCISLATFDETSVPLLIKECGFIRIIDFAKQIELSEPEYAEKIETILPLFQWIPPVPNSLLSYNFTLFPIYANQSNELAVVQNAPIYEQGNVKTNFLKYPVNAPMLEFGKDYVWQVHVYSNQVFSHKSEIWIFTPVKDGPLNDDRDDYRVLSRQVNSDFYSFNDKIKFLYNNRSHQSKLDYKIIDLSENRILENLPEIPLNERENEISINCNDINGLLNKKPYKLVVYTATKEVLHLNFKRN